MVEKEKEVEMEEEEQAEAVPTEAAVEAEAEATVEDIEALQQELEEERRKASEQYDQWLRSVAELRNYKKRVEQERQQVIRGANATLVSHLLPALDDFERAMAVLPDEKLARFSWVEGILLVYRRILAVLEQHGLQAIEAVGQPFDPYVHDAILFEEVPADRDQVVLAELQRGYKLHERLLRPALVKVGKTAPPPVPPEEGEETPAAQAQEPTPIAESEEQSAPAAEQ